MLCILIILGSPKQYLNNRRALYDQTEAMKPNVCPGLAAAAVCAYGACQCWLPTDMAIIILIMMMIQDNNDDEE